MRKILIPSLLIILTLFVFRDKIIVSFQKTSQKIKWQSDTVSVVFVGDIMMHSKQLDYDYTSFLDPISDYLQVADLAVGNFEFPLAGTPYTGYPLFSTPDEYAQTLVDKNGFDIILTANNHILDKGDKGFTRTLQQYQKLNAEYTGSGLDKADFKRVNPLIISRKGIKFAFINFTYGSNVDSKEDYPKLFLDNKADILAAIQKAKEADFIIALPHWGIEYKTIHNKQQEQLATWLVEQGVDLIIGSHPHVVQDIDTINGVTVVYSLGNLVSNMSVDNTQKGLVVKVDFINDHINNQKSIIDYETRYTWCKLPVDTNDNYQVSFIK